MKVIEAPAVVRRLVASGLGRHVLHAEQIHSGNSKVLRLHCDDKAVFIAKVYPPMAADRRDRLNVEFDALRFLHRHNVRLVPEPLLRDEQERIAIYQHLDGERPVVQDVGVAEVDEAVDFLRVLDGLTQTEDSACLPAASEAAFSMADYLDGARRRLVRLAEIQGTTPLHVEAQEFARADLARALDRVEAHCMRQAARLGWPMDNALPVSMRTLSPSDFGFHNAIRCQNGKLRFIDFEYFGWDDPAKLIADFVHHPAMPIPRDLTDRFRLATLKLYRRDPNLPARLDLVFPVLGLKWCMIMLNEFLPEPLGRRRLANSELIVGDAIALQLRKARAKLDEVEEFMAMPALSTGVS